MKKTKKPLFKNNIYSIKSKVSLLCTIFILIAVTFNYIFLSYVSKKAITHNTEAAMEDLASAYSTNLTETISKLSRSGNFMMNSDIMTSDISTGTKKNASDIKDLIHMYLEANTSTEEINITDAKGIVVFSSNSRMVGKDLSKEAYFSKMMNTKVSTQSDVIQYGKSKEACVIFASPLRNSGNSSGKDITAAPQASQNNASALKGSSNKGPANTSEKDIMNQPVEKFIGAITTVVKVSEFSSALSNISVSSYKSGYTFILDSNGNYVYHPKDALIGTKADISEILNTVKQAKSGKNFKSKVITYTYNGVKKYAGFSVDTDNNWILFVTAEQSDILSQLNKVSTQSLYASIIIVLILSILAYLFAGTITTSIKEITRLINKTAELDFSDNSTSTLLSSKKDETGEMSRAIEKMRRIMKGMIENVNEISQNITKSSNDLHHISYSVNEHASDNSATAEELSASMQETAATTEHIGANIEQIGCNSRDINDKTAYGAQLSTELMKRAQDVKAVTLTAAEKTQKIYGEVKKKTDAAIEQSKSVEKINLLTNTIRDIASQTSLLALNASIEAARAGDAGRGFSIVASEIGTLADESAKTVSNITDIVTEVHVAVDNMAKSLEQTLAFLEKNVLEDYNGFIDSSEKYNTDAETMNDTMKNIQSEIDALNNNVHSISDAISEINTMINEASKGVVDVADKNTNIVALTSDTQKMSEENKNLADRLNDFVEKFKI